MSEEIKSVIDNLNSTFENFKSENTKRLDEIEKKGSADPILEEKVDKMADDISKMAEAKQKIQLPLFLTNRQMLSFECQHLLFRQY